MNYNEIGYMALPKNAHTSISNMFPKINNFPDFNHKWLTKGKHQSLRDEELLNSYKFLFTSVRNPYTRFISSFNECKRYGYKNNIENFILDYKSNRLNSLQLWHTQPQCFHLIFSEINFFIRIEYFKKDVTRLCNLIQIKTPFLKTLNRNYNDIVLTTENKKYIREIYEKDFELLKDIYEA